MNNESWRRSNLSEYNSDCIELGWKKSSSSGQNAQCVEVRQDANAIRDSKNPDGPILSGIQARSLVAFARTTK